MKKYIKYALVFLGLGIACGIFFREFTKAYELENTYTTLGAVHPHFLVLGVAFILLIGLVTEKLSRGDTKLFRIGFPLYSVGVLGTGLMLLVRGIFDVLVKSPKVAFEMTKGASAAVSGVAGIFHTVLGAGLVIIFIAWLLKDKKSTDKSQSEVDEQ